MNEPSWDDPTVEEHVAEDAAVAEETPIEATDQIPGQGVPAGVDFVEPEASVSPGTVRMKVAAPHSGLSVGYAGVAITDEWSVVTEQQAAVLRNAAVEQGVTIDEETVQ